MGPHWEQGAPRTSQPGPQAPQWAPRELCFPALWLGQFGPISHMLRGPKSCSQAAQPRESSAGFRASFLSLSLPLPAAPTCLPTATPVQAVPSQWDPSMSWSGLVLGKVLGQRPKAEPHGGLTSRSASILRRREMSRNWLSESAPLVYCHRAGPFLPRGETCREIGLVFCKSLLRTHTHTHTFSWPGISLCTMAECNSVSPTPLQCLLWQRIMPTACRGPLPASSPQTEELTMTSIREGEEAEALRRKGAFSGSSSQRLVRLRVQICSAWHQVGKPTDLPHCFYHLHPASILESEWQILAKPISQEHKAGRGWLL